MTDLPDYIERLPPHVELPPGVHIWGMGPNGSIDLPSYIETPIVGILLNRGNRFSYLLPLRPTQQQVDEAIRNMLP